MLFCFVLILFNFALIGVAVTRLNLSRFILSYFYAAYLSILNTILSCMYMVQTLFYLTTD